MKQKVQLRITEVNRARRRVVGSIRSVSDEARRAAQEVIFDAQGDLALFGVEGDDIDLQGVAHLADYLPVYPRPAGRACGRRIRQ